MTTDEQKHTPTPWRICKHSLEGIEFDQANGGGWFLRIYAGYPYGSFPDPREVEETTEANAARIIACVNACESMPDPAAEIARLRKLCEPVPTLGGHVYILKNVADAERDRLREANGEMLEAIQWALDDAINGQISYVGKNKLRALIAKHSAHGQEKGG